MALTLIKYRLLALQLAPLHPQQHYIWCSTGYFSYSWHHCTHKVTSSDSVPVTCHTDGITVPTTALTQIQYQLLPLLLAPLYLQQYQLWCSTGYFPYSWHHCTYNSTSSDAVPLLASRYLRLQLTPCSLWFYCLNFKQRVHFYFSQNELHAYYGLVYILIFRLTPRQETINYELSLSLTTLTKYINYNI